MKQLTLLKKINENQFLKGENLDINNFFSPLCQTLLISIEEILDSLQQLEIFKGKCLNFNQLSKG